MNSKNSAAYRLDLFDTEPDYNDFNINNEFLSHNYQVNVVEFKNINHISKGSYIKFGGLVLREGIEYDFYNFYTSLKTSLQNINPQDLSFNNTRPIDISFIPLANHIELIFNKKITESDILGTMNTNDFSMVGFDVTTLIRLKDID